MIKKADCVEVVETTSDTVMEIDNQLRIGEVQVGWKAKLMRLKLKIKVNGDNLWLQIDLTFLTVKTIDKRPWAWPWSLANCYVHTESNTQKIRTNN